MNLTYSRLAFQSALAWNDRFAQRDLIEAAHSEAMAYNLERTLATSDLARVILTLETEYGIEGDSYQFTSIWQTILTKVATEDAELVAEVAADHEVALTLNTQYDFGIAAMKRYLANLDPKVSLVKAAPSSYQAAGHPAGMADIHRNDLRLLHWAIAGGTL
jgi:hypothetical protein